MILPILAIIIILGFIGYNLYKLGEEKGRKDYEL
jgi:hypothetical protein